MCSLTQSFPLLGNSLLWSLGALEDSNRECAGSLLMPNRPYEWYVDAHGCYKFNNADLALGPRDTTAHFPVFFYINAPPTSQALTASRAANKPSRNAWNVKLPSMSENNAAENSPSLQLLDMPVPPLRENSGCSLRVAAAPSGEPHCSDTCMLSIWCR